MEIRITRPLLKVFSAILSNLSAAWIIAMVVTRNPVVLTGNAILAIVSLYSAIKIEELLEEND